MSKFLEKNLIDKLINGKLLGKRKIDLPVKYFFNRKRDVYQNRFIDTLYNPRNKFDKIVGNFYEKCMPGLKLLFWDNLVREARYTGYTLAEGLYGNLRHTAIARFHSMGQQIHPYGWLEAQRRGAFFEPYYCLMQGISCPDWAQETRRTKDLDLNSVKTPFDAFQQVVEETTPSQTGEAGRYVSLFHLFEQRHTIGYVGQRLFYNEELRGDFYRNGHLTQKDRDIIHGWYCNAQNDSRKQYTDNLSQEEREELEKNKARWDKNLKEFFPELDNTTHHKILHKYDEPYFERNMQEIRCTIFTNKWISCVDKFTQDEIQLIHEFFLNENTNAFFTRETKEDQMEPTELYKKFVQELNFPNICEIDRFTTYPPEKQFYDLMDKNWGINF
jgi:hypothetical protein